MFRKVVFSFMFIFMILALLLVGSNVTQEELTANFMSFIKTISQRFREVDWSIPSIPKLEPVGNGFIDTIATIINILSGLVNVVIFVLNFVIHFFTYIYAIISSVREISVVPI